MAHEGWLVALKVREWLINHPPSYPLTIAKALGFTRAEVQLSLWYWPNVKYRDDGRFYWKEEL